MSTKESTRRKLPLPSLYSCISTTRDPQDHVTYDQLNLQPTYHNIPFKLFGCLKEMC